MEVKGRCSRLMLVKLNHWFKQFSTLPVNAISTGVESETENGT